jgi:hypothetical protein
MSSKTQSLSLSSSSLAATLDEIMLPYQEELLDKVAGVAPNNALESVRVQLDAMLDSLKIFKDDVKAATIQIKDVLLDPKKYTDDYQSELLDQFNTALAQFVNDSSIIVFEGMLDKPEPDISINKDDYNSDIDKYNVTFTPTITPSDFATEFNYSLSSLLSSYINSVGTGLDATTETAMWNRSRNRMLYESARIARRITSQIMSRLPYSGGIIDALSEADNDSINQMGDTNNKIIEVQGDLTYKASLDRIQTALQFEKDLAGNYYKTKDLLLDATAKKDGFNKDQDTMNMQAWENNRERFQKADIEQNRLEVEKYRVSIEKAKAIFETRRSALDAIANMEGIASGHYEKMKNILLQADTSLDELQIKNQWAYVEHTVNAMAEYLKQILYYLTNKINTDGQSEFDNFLAMAKVATDGTLSITGLMANMTGTG